MNQYTHPDLNGIYPQFEPAVLPDGTQLTRAWFRTSSPQLIAAKGFVKFTPPEPEPYQPTGADVNAERHRRILAGTTVIVTGIGDIPVTGTDDDTRNLQGLVTAAQLRLGQGDTATLTPFRDAANVVHDLTPMQMVELWQKAAGYVSAVYQASWDIKAMEPIPADFADDSRWPTE